VRGRRNVKKLTAILASAGQKPKSAGGPLATDQWVKVALVPRLQRVVNGSLLPYSASGPGEPVSAFIAAFRVLPDHASPGNLSVNRTAWSSLIAFENVL
jgi:hypothetical protein